MCAYLLPGAGDSYAGLSFSSIEPIPVLCVKCDLLCTPQAKVKAFEEAGVPVGDTLEQVVQLAKERLG